MKQGLYSFLNSLSPLPFEQKSTLEEMELLFYLSYEIDSAKIQYRRINLKIKSIPSQIKLTIDEMWKLIRWQQLIIVDIKYLFCSLEKIRKTIFLLEKQDNQYFHNLIENNKNLLFEWSKARVEIDHINLPLQSVRLNPENHFPGNFDGKYFLLSNKKFDVFVKSPKLLKDIQERLLEVVL